MDDMVIYFAALALLVTSGLCVSTEKHFVGRIYLLTISFCILTLLSLRFQYVFT